MSKKKAKGNYRKSIAPPKSRRWLYINIALAVLVMVAGIGGLWWVNSQNSAQAVQPQQFAGLNQPAANISLTNLAGETVQLSDYQGKVVLLNFWASWCPPCIAELPDIHRFYQANQENDFVVLAVNVKEPSGTVQQFISEQGFTFPVLLDSAGVASGQYDAVALPMSFIIDKTGVVQNVHRGVISPEQLAAYVDPLL